MKVLYNGSKRVITKGGPKLECLYEYVFKKFVANQDGISYAFELSKRTWYHILTKERGKVEYVRGNMIENSHVTVLLDGNSNVNELYEDPAKFWETYIAGKKEIHPTVTKNYDSEYNPTGFLKQLKEEELIT